MVLPVESVLSIIIFRALPAEYMGPAGLQSKFWALTKLINPDKTINPNTFSVFFEIDIIIPKWC